MITRAKLWWKMVYSGQQRGVRVQLFFDNRCKPIRVPVLFRVIFVYRSISFVYLSSEIDLSSPRSYRYLFNRQNINVKRSSPGVICRDSDIERCKVSRSRIRERRSYERDRANNRADNAQETSTKKIEEFDHGVQEAGEIHTLHKCTRNNNAFERFQSVR